MSEEYYVYIYLDPRKTDKFTYDGLEFNNEPIYVGKGKGMRYSRHLKDAKNDSGANPIKRNKINKILSEGFNPIIIKYKENLSSIDAYKLEVELISKIGRSINNTGPLTNVKPGGEEGPEYNHIHSNEYIDTLCKPVDKYDLNGNFLESYKSLNEAGEKNNINPTAVSQCCRLLVKIILNKYIFIFKGDELNINKRVRNVNNNIIQRIDYLGNITEYESMSEAVRVNNILRGDINDVCIGKRFLVHGFLWRHKEHEKLEQFNNDINLNYGKYLYYIDKKIIDKQGNEYLNIIHLLNSVKNAKANNIYCLISAGKIYKAYDKV